MDARYPLSMSAETRARRGRIEHRVGRGRLHLVMRGVYAVGWPRLTRERRWMAAVLACGEGAALSHRSAAGLWRIGEEQRGQIDVSVGRRCELRHPGLRVRGRPTLSDGDFTVIDGIPVTSVVRTLIDLAAELDPLRVERAVNEADKRDLIDPEALRFALDDHTGEPGTPALRSLLDRRTSPLRLRPGDSLPPDRGEGGSATSPHQTARQRLRGRFLLARPGADRRDGRPPLPPNALYPGARRATRPRPHPRRDDPHALHALRDPPRILPSPRRAAASRPNPGGRIRC